MIKDSWVLQDELNQYAAPKNKIRLMEKNGQLFRINKGLYETDNSILPFLLAGNIYGPSYISFEYALAWYGLIPERVECITSATCGKNRTKLFNNVFGSFSYHDVPTAVFPHNVVIKKANERFFLMAEPEKAVCDVLYAKKAISKLTDLEMLLFEDLRIDENSFGQLNKSIIHRLCPLYGRKNLQMLAKYFSKERS